MVGDLLSPESAGDIQVTGKVSMANVDAVNATSVIRSPPNSGDEEDSSWFLREMLHRRVAAHSSPAPDDEDDDNRDDDHHHSIRDLHSGASGRLLSHKAPNSLLGLALTVRKSSERKNSPSFPQATSTPALSQVKRSREPSTEDEVNSKIEFERNLASSLSPSSAAAAMSKADHNLNPTQPSHVRASPQLVVNGCKKRKLYQPQQHESARYSSDDDDQYFLPRPEPSSLGGGPHVSNPQRPLQTGVSHTSLPGLADPLKTLQDQMEALQSKYAHAYAAEQTALALANAVTPRVPVRDRAVRDDAKMTASAASARAHQRLPSTTNPMSCHNLSQLSQAVYLDATRRLILEQEVRLQRDARDREGMQPTSVNELEGLAEILKQEIASSLTVIIDATLTRFAQRRAGKESFTAATVGPTKNEELTANTATSFDAKSPRGRVVDRGSRTEPPQVSSTPPVLPTHTQLASFLRSPLNLPAAFFQQPGSAGKLNPAFYHGLNSLSAITTLANLASPNTPPTSHSGAHYSSHTAPPSPPTYPYDDNNEQCEALSLVKRQSSAVNSKHNATTPPMSSSPTPSPSPSPSPAYPPTSAGNLSTSVAISNPYTSFYRTHSPSSACDSKREREVSSPNGPLSAPHPASLLHPALLAAHGGDLSHLHYRHELVERGSEGSVDSGCGYDALAMLHASTLTPMHLRKAKLMFFWVRYPSSSVLKTFFPDVKFNKNNTAQLVKWFSNFREFYYIQMEKYSRHLLSQGLTSPDDIYITADSELFRVLNLHYNRNNHVQAPPQFLYVVTQTMKEFFRAIQAGKDAEPSWKKAIYKVIARLDDSVPEYFKTPNFLEQLEYRND